MKGIDQCQKKTRGELFVTVSSNVETNNDCISGDSLDRKILTGKETLIITKEDPHRWSGGDLSDDGTEKIQVNIAFVDILVSWWDAKRQKAVTVPPVVPKTEFRFRSVRQKGTPQGEAVHVTGVDGKVEPLAREMCE
jgi:hypothetical protein